MTATRNAVIDSGMIRCEQCGATTTVAELPDDGQSSWTPRVQRWLGTHKHLSAPRRPPKPKQPTRQPDRRVVSHCVWCNRDVHAVRQQSGTYWLREHQRTGSSICPGSRRWVSA